MIREFPGFDDSSMDGLRYQIIAVYLLTLPPFPSRDAFLFWGENTLTPIPSP
jgi:hypothetical protein